MTHYTYKRVKFKKNTKQDVLLVSSGPAGTTERGPALKKSFSDSKHFRMKDAACESIHLTDEETKAQLGGLYFHTLSQPIMKMRLQAMSDFPVILAHLHQEGGRSDDCEP